MKKFLLLFLIISFIESLEEIEYRKINGYLGRVLENFAIKFNRINDEIKAEYEETIYDFDNIEYKSKGRKTFNLTNEELGLPSMKKLFKQFNKINFPDETDWIDHYSPDYPTWTLIIDGKLYYTNYETDFIEQFQEVVNIHKLNEYIKKIYDQ